MKPLISICIPTYNRAKFLGSTLDSIIRQSFNNIEIIISDNASTDNTAEIIMQYQTLFPFIVYHREESNMGADSNYLKVIELASAEYCWLFGSDDVMKDGAIDIILKEIKTKFDVYVCGLTLCSYDMTPIIDHKIFNLTRDEEFDLSNKEIREKYFCLAQTTTALFSFIGSLIINKKKWDLVQIEREKFNGSLWIHVAKILGMIPLGLSVKYLHSSLIFKRGDNDSFMNNGIAGRIAISVNGYKLISTNFFQKRSIEDLNIRRVIKFEWPLIAFIKYRKILKINNPMEINALTQIFLECYCDESIGDKLVRLIYKSNIGSRVYYQFSLFKQVVKKILYAKY